MSAVIMMAATVLRWTMGRNVSAIEFNRLMDDDFMSKCFEENIECTELVLHIVLGRDDLIILDIYAADETGKQYLEERKAVANRLLKKGGMAFDDIAEISQLSVEEVRVLADKRGT